MLLPDIYHAYDRIGNPKYGGLIGEMEYFLALIALSMPQEHLPHVLPTMYSAGSWRNHGHRYPRTCAIYTSNEDKTSQVRINVVLW